MTDITPTPELVEQWALMLEQHADTEVFTAAARWGADQELEACVQWISEQDWTWTSAQLQRARRPQPPSPKEQALQALDEEKADMSIANYQTIRTVLEQLDD
jgi:hypothetical protein